ncbi:hypothetical protein K9U39_11900 [Rhodoblastus acidophilus]|uniref:Uncharacterized protein n=1 Tax=Candidatus Rhodoblastus alkanivorans TaxID=2954117 RepID=A0ABS9Z9Q7_9HYPH|nr:hypothetical protein [Candidatus Rhodoblastus alkanivorans]MCI4679768.1 hypothetical protein [Candidatus Rhodoblastus alkanivorans]MCI4684312.1 hypothetical protein [Candidatus Rhodoblastus alkanivorans]MDI4641633.1 hypothetical protein [Rhodoblastus acidophilus]
MLRWTMMVLLITTAAAQAATYDFLPAPQIDLNRVYRLDKATGEVGACQFGLKDGAPVGVTLCYPPGDGGGPQVPGEYALVATRHEREASVFRVNQRTGEMSICYVLKGAVVCTPPAK